MICWSVYPLVWLPVSPFARQAGIIPATFIVQYSILYFAGFAA